MDPDPPILLLEGIAEPFMRVGLSGLLKFTLLITYLYHVEGYGEVIFYYEEIHMMYPLTSP